MVIGPIMWDSPAMKLSHDGEFLEVTVSHVPVVKTHLDFYRSFQSKT